MKAKIILSFFLVTGSLFVQAQNPEKGKGGPDRPRLTAEQRTKRIVDTLVTEFKINSDQQTEVTALYMDYYKGMDKMREAMQQGNDVDRTAFQKQGTDKDEKLKKVLGEENFKKFKENIEPAISPRRGGGMGPRGSGGKPKSI